MQQRQNADGLAILPDHELTTTLSGMDYPDDPEMEERDRQFANFFDSVIIPASEQREKLDPRIRSVSARSPRVKALSR